MRAVFAFVLASLAFGPALSQDRLDAGYLELAACAVCHSQIYESYRRTGMGRSFYRPSAAAKLAREIGEADFLRNNT
jgi:hypothetical protein